MNITTYPKNSSELKVFIFSTVMEKLNVFTTDSTEKVIESITKIYSSVDGDDFKGTSDEIHTVTNTLSGIVKTLLNADDSTAPVQQDPLIVLDNDEGETEVKTTRTRKTK